MDGRVEEMASKMAAVHGEKTAASGDHADTCSCGVSDTARSQLQIKTATNTPYWRALKILLKVC